MERLGVTGFEKIFPNIVETAVQVEHFLKIREKDVLIEKQVKSGARKLIEYLAIHNTQVPHDVPACQYKLIRHMYITKLSRKDIVEQYEEMREYGIQTERLNNKSDLSRIVRYMETLLADEEYEIWVHLDESDYGTGDKQLLNKFFVDYRNRDGVYFIAYSASNEEAILSEYNDPAYREVIQLIPGPDYKGVVYFLDNGLVHDVKEPFWNFDTNHITMQGKECLNYLLDSPDKIFGIVRLTGKKSSYREAFHSNTFKQYFNSKGIKVVFVDGEREFIWGNATNASWREYVHLYGQTKLKVLIIINQTCSRSTEIGFHEHLAFLHDYRAGKTTYNTKIQAYGRAFHYNAGGHKIHVYAEVNTFRRAAKRISDKGYVSRTGCGISPRVKSTFVVTNWCSEFIAKTDPSLTLLVDFEGKHSNPIYEFEKGRVVPSGYDNAGHTVWTSSDVTAWKNEEGRGPMYNVIHGTPRSLDTNLMLIDPNSVNVKGDGRLLKYDRVYLEDLLPFLAEGLVTCKDGRLVVDVLNSSEGVFFFACPLQPSEVSVVNRAHKTMFD